MGRKQTERRPKMKGIAKLVTAALSAAALFSMTVFAAGWTNGQGANSARWWYDLGDGTYYAGTVSAPAWYWIDGNGDGMAECYAFDAEGWMYADTRTPDGYEVNADGAWTVGGAVQTQTGGAAGGTDSSAGSEATDGTGGNGVLIAYFSRTGTTESAARSIQSITGGTLFEIEPADAYPSSYSETTARAQREINAGTLPALSSDLDSLDGYEIIFIGYPIWWGVTPPVVNTFMNSHDFTGKTVVPFCTSGGSGISGSLSNVRSYCSGATVLSGRDLTGDSTSEIQSWISGLNLS